MASKTKNKVKVKCVIVGDQGVGKRSLLTRYCKNTFYTDYVSSEPDTPTVDIKVGKTEASLHLQVLAGQDDCDKLRAVFYPGTDVFLLCFDIGNKDSADGIATRWQPELFYHCGHHTPLVLVGTKLDTREQDWDTHKMMTTPEGQELARSVQAVKYAECSALSGVGVPEVFQQAVTAHVHRRRRLKNGEQRFCALL